MALTENLVKIVDVMRQRLEHRSASHRQVCCRLLLHDSYVLYRLWAGCAAGYIEDHRGMCVKITSQPRKAPARRHVVVFNRGRVCPQNHSATPSSIVPSPMSGLVRSWLRPAA